MTIIIIALILAAGAASVKNIVALQVEHARLEKENIELTKKRERLRIELKHVNSIEYIEQQARRQLRLVKPDELLFVFDDGEDEEVEDEGAKKPGRK